MFDIKITDVIIGDRVRTDMGDLDDLANSMRDIGLMHPVVVNSKLQLIAGQRRLEAARKLGWTKIKATKLDIADIVEGESDENIIRKDFTYTEKLRLYDMIRKELGERRGGDRGNQYTGGKVHNCALRQNALDDTSGNKSRQIAAKRAGLGSHGTEQRVRDIVKYGTAELVRQMDAGEVTVAQAWERSKLNKPKQDKPQPKAEPKAPSRPTLVISNRPQLKDLAPEQTGKPVGAEALEPDPDNPTVTKGFSYIAKHGMVQAFPIDEKRKMDFRAQLYELTGKMKQMAGQDWYPCADDFTSLLTDKQQADFRRQWAEYIAKIERMFIALRVLVDAANQPTAQSA